MEAPIDLKLSRLDGVQAAKFWPVLGSGFMRSLPPGAIPNEETSNNLLVGVLSKRYDCWIFQLKRNDKQRFAGGFLCEVSVEPVTGTRALVIYSLFNLFMMSDEEWARGFELLRLAAKRYKCSTVRAFSKHPSVIKLIERNGGNADMRVVELEV